MNILSLNIRGLGGKDPNKIAKVSSLLSLHRINFGAFQETFMSTVNLVKIRNLWGNHQFDFATSSARGHSGGILSIWNPGMFRKHKVLSFPNVLIVEGTWLLLNIRCFMINIYAPQNDADKKDLWIFLTSFLNSCGSNAILFGDFNSVRNTSERIGSSLNVGATDEFNSFITSNNLVDMVMGGYRFTRVGGCSSAKLDRFLISASLLSSVTDLVAMVLDRTISDHHPITLCQRKFDYGPSPFKVFNSWSHLDGFGSLVKYFWTTDSVNVDCPITKFRLKLKNLKGAIKEWIFAKKDNKSVLNWKKQLSDLDYAHDAGVAASNYWDKRKDILHNLLEAELCESLDLKQKSKIKWAVEADENTSFFHAYVNKARKNSSILGIKKDGIWVDNPSEVKQMFFDHFSSKFKRQGCITLSSRSSFFKSISSDQASSMERPVSLCELKDAVWGCGNEKSPGPDGFTFGFIKEYWDVFQEDVFAFVTRFFQTGYLPPGCNSSFITLIPKVLNPLTVEDFRPISLIGVQYKIIAKILANRLSLVIHSVISPTQSAFLKNRNILDGPLILNEILDYFKRKKKKALFLKFDIAKAYDSLSWSYLMSIFSFMGFGHRWISWISGCLWSTRTSILVNGSPTDEFSFERGIRQGDPMAPFLFIVAMEGLHVALEDLKANDAIHGLKIGNISISHLFYADDVFFMGEWGEDNLKNIMMAFSCFYLASGLKLNLHKSKLYGIGVRMSEIDHFANLVGCGKDNLPFSYLGIPIGANMSKSASWKPIEDKFSKRLSKWKANLLSIGGRATLVTSVLGSLGSYFMSLFKMPNAVRKRLESLRAKFFWGGSEDSKKLHWINWDRTLASKSCGGLGLGSLDALNKGLLLKWRWRYVNEPNSLWVSILQNIYSPLSFWDWTKNNNLKHGVWSQVSKIAVDLHGKSIIPLNSLAIKIGNGEATLFWHDIWLGNRPLMHRFPRLFNLDQDKNCNVASKWNGSTFFSNWRRPLRGGVEEAEWMQLFSELSAKPLDTCADKWIWTCSTDSTFTVKDARTRIDAATLPSCQMVTRWCKFVPKKVNIFVWRLLNDRLPTRTNLDCKGIDVPVILCPLCNDFPETASHLFLSCKVAEKICDLLGKWLEIQPTGLTSILACLDYLDNLQVTAMKRSCLDVIFFCTWWCIWRHRNDIVFNPGRHNREFLFDTIVSQSYLWITSRCKKLGISKDNWFQNPLLFV